MPAEAPAAQRPPEASAAAQPARPCRSALAVLPSAKAPPISFCAAPSAPARSVLTKAAEAHAQVRIRHHARDDGGRRVLERAVDQAAEALLPLAQSSGGVVGPSMGIGIINRVELSRPAFTSLKAFEPIVASMRLMKALKLAHNHF